MHTHQIDQPTHELQTLYLGADHGGFELKEKCKQWLDEWGYSYQDCGALELIPTDDYPEYAFNVATKVAAQITQAKNNQSGRKTEIYQVKGLLFCRSGGGMVIAANKVLGIRAVSVSSPIEAAHACKDNDAHILSISSDWITDEVAQETIQTFLITPFSNAPRHVRRISHISEYEQKSKNRKIKKYEF